MIILQGNLNEISNDIGLILLRKKIPIHFSHNIALYARPYIEIPEPRFKRGDTVYSKFKSQVTLFIYDNPYWCTYKNSWIYNYEYGLTGSEGSAIESKLYKN